MVLMRNEHGHVVLPLGQMNFIHGPEELKALGATHVISERARRCLEHPIYVKAHAVPADVERVVVVPTKELVGFPALHLTEVCRERFGYFGAVAGLVPRIRVTCSDEEMRGLGLWYITTPHVPIPIPGECPGLLRSDAVQGGRAIRAYSVGPSYTLDLEGAVAFPVW
jgi:hypothetical protein